MPHRDGAEQSQQVVGDATQQRDDQGASRVELDPRMLVFAHARLALGKVVIAAWDRRVLAIEQDGVERQLVRLEGLAAVRRRLVVRTRRDPENDALDQALTRLLLADGRNFSARLPTMPDWSTDSPATRGRKEFPSSPRCSRCRRAPFSRRRRASRTGRVDYRGPRGHLPCRASRMRRTTSSVWRRIWSSGNRKTSSPAPVSRRSRCTSWGGGGSCCCPSASRQIAACSQ